MDIHEKYIEHFSALGYEALVPGQGPLNADIMLIGEAPGEQEVKQRKAFVGAAGKNLDIFLEAIHLRRDEIYITNAVKFRPTSAGPTGRLRNRTPAMKEVALFMPWLRAEIEHISPRVLVTLGNTALRAVSADNSMTIGMCHGCTQDFNGRLLFPLYHPASVIYNRALGETYYQDLAALAELIAKL